MLGWINEAKKIVGKLKWKVVEQSSKAFKTWVEERAAPSEHARALYRWTKQPEPMAPAGFFSTYMGKVVMQPVDICAHHRAYWDDWWRAQPGEASTVLQAHAAIKDYR